MMILIREGSAARNFDALVSLFESHPEMLMFCSDDKHPDELLESHINALVRRAVAVGYDLYDVLRAASVNPVVHYSLPVGLLREGDAADFILVENLQDFTVLKTYINGVLVAENGNSLLLHEPPEPINQFRAKPITVDVLKVKASSWSDENVSQNLPISIPTIVAQNGQLVTKRLMMEATLKDDLIIADAAKDMLKLVVLNRYEENAVPAMAFIKNFGLKSGALASTIAHDCHNIIAVGENDEALAEAINEVIRLKGGIAVSGAQLNSMALHVAGLMSLENGEEVAKQYTQLDAAAKALGCTLDAPFMTLSFMALLVIPELKLSDKGLFDGLCFGFV